MMIPKDDFSCVKAALERAQEYTGKYRHGGLQELHDDLTWALEALERVRVAWEERPAQTVMFEVEGELAE